MPLRSLLPSSLQGRIVLVMALSVALAQVVGTWLWARQITHAAMQDAQIAARSIATNAAGTLRFFNDLPKPYRPILVEQQRAMGGSRFLISANTHAIDTPPFTPSALTQTVVEVIKRTLAALLPGVEGVRVDFAWPHHLVVTDSGTQLNDLPETWIDGTLRLQPKPAPVLVIQAEFEPGAWLYLATTMPDPYFFEDANPITASVAWLQLFTLIIVIVLTALLMRSLIQPFNRLAQAANAIGQGREVEPIAEFGSTEVRRTAHAFNAMQRRIQRYVQDRQRLFVDISHSLKTPITRMKLRTEMLDDDALREDYHEDLDELDLMVKAALQSVRDSDVHENTEPTRLEHLIERLAKRPIYPEAKINLSLAPVKVMTKPLALTRALGNLIDNAILYGQRVDITLEAVEQLAVIELRDHGPGIPESAMARAFEPHVRLAHGQRENRSGTGLGLGIAREIVEAHGGQLTLRNHPKGGLVVRIELPGLLN